ncbi:MAG: hypothetical protein Q4B30_05605 [Coriobacteriaceae bacterium]|nr:hypothetical protein [Coriobacteriaceae bacterium]
MMGHTKHRARWGVDLFIEDGAYTTLSAAVSILLVLVLLFSSTAAFWSMSRAGDVQTAADTGSLAGANVVSSYYTAATTMDACVLSLGLAGFVLTGAGMVGLVVPGAQAAGAKAVDAGVKVIDARNRFATSASKGLSSLEKSIPFLVAANSTRTIAAQNAGSMQFTGLALPAPRTSASSFPALDGPGISTDGLKGSAHDLGEAAEELRASTGKAEDAKRAAWLADCGSEGANMQERAAKLTGLSGSQNPDFDSSLTWKPEIAIARTRAYYRWRAENNDSEGQGAEARADAAARQAFYEYADREFARARYEESGSKVICVLPRLPKNMAEMKETTLYTDARWPTTSEAGGRVLHYGADCPGATGAPAGAAPVSAVDSGQVKECPVCHFGPGDLGKVAQASSSISNGFEYHLRAFEDAMDAYVPARSEELAAQERARGSAEAAGDSFEEAISALKGPRPTIAPPGREGCVSLAVSGPIDAKGAFSNPFAPPKNLSERGAIAAARLHKDPATKENNVLSSFFSSLSRADSISPGSLMDKVMDLWGGLLVGYGDMGKSVSDAFGGLRTAMGGIGAPLVDWLGDRIAGVLDGLGLAPVDLSLRKPVLSDTSEVLRAGGFSGAAEVQGMLRRIPLGVTDPASLMQAVGEEVGDYIKSMEFVLAEIPLPGGGSIPITVRLRDIIGGE